MKLLSLDFESSWSQPVDPKKCRITEVGAVLFDWENKRPLKVLSELVWEKDYPPSPPELVEITGLEDHVLMDYGVSPERALHNLLSLIKQADFIVAHNGTFFDKPLLESELAKLGLVMPEVPWIDTRVDVPYPKSIKVRSLSQLAPEHGFLNPFKHRALFDAMTTLKILSHYVLDDVIALSKEPLIHAVALVSFQDKDKAKNAGYYWDGDKKVWFKAMKESYFEAEAERVPFIINKFYPEVG